MCQKRGQGEIIVRGVCSVLLGSTEAALMGFFCVIFQQNGQNGRPGGREASQSIGFDETTLMVLV